MAFDPSEQLKQIKEALEYGRLLDIRSDIVKFAEYAMFDDNGNHWTVADHQKEWFGVLMGVVEFTLKMKDATNNEEIDRSQKRNVIIMAPREHAKTNTLIAWLIYLMGNYPNLRIKYVSASEEHSINVLGQIKKNIEGNPLLHEVFPNLRRDPNGRWSSTEIDILKLSENDKVMFSDFGIKDPSIKACGILSSGTGGRADIIVFDDMIGSRSALTEPGRMDTIKSLFYQDWLNIGKYCNVVIGTPWTPDDIHADLKQDTEWISWSKPAIDDNGEPLWKERWPLEELMKKRKQIGETSFDLQYMLKGMKDKIQWWTNTIVERCKDYTLKMGDTRHKLKGVVIGLDPASSQKKGSSYSCLTVVGYDNFKHKTILGIRRMRSRPKDVAEALIDMYLQEYQGLKAECVLVENNATQDAYIDLIDVIAQNKYHDLRIPLQHQFTGTQKWNPEIGLPRLVASMERGMYSIPYDGEHGDPLHECFSCSLIKELLGYPYETDTTDMIMSLWLADSAIERQGMFGDLPIVGSSNRVNLGWSHQR